MISVERALQIVLENTPVLDTVSIPILQSKFMVLAEDIVSSEDIPPFDMAMVDGFAAMSEDIVKAITTSPVVLKLDCEIKVGCPRKEPLQSGHAAKIASGAPLPEGANCIVLAENAVRDSASRVKIYKYEKPGENIFFKGDDIPAGTPVLNKGKVLNGADIGLLAAIGCREVLCHRRPRVSFFASGNDLLAPEQPLQDGKMRTGNTFIMQCQLDEYGAEPINLGIIGADSEEVRLNIEKALCSDMFITSVGSAMEDFDFVKNTLQRAGMDLKFWRVAIRPGKPLIFGTFNSIPVFGLPGNYLSSIVILEEFVRPAIMKMQGKGELRHTEVIARLEREVKGGGNMTHFVRAEVKVTDEGFLAIPAGAKSSPSVMAFCSVNGFIVIPEDVNYYKAGELVRVQILSDPSYIN